jgi:hypothetical protein
MRCVTASVLVLLGVVISGATAIAAGGGAFEIRWYTIDGGGGFSSGSDFELSGTIGQPDAATLSGGIYTLEGGFWPGGTVAVACPADLDGSGAVDFADLLAILAAWGNIGGPEDLDGSGTVDFGDLLLVLAQWGACP